MYKIGNKIKIIGNISSTAGKFSGQIATIIAVYGNYCDIDLEFKKNGSRKSNCGGIWFKDIKKLDLQDHCAIINKAIEEIK